MLPYLTVSDGAAAIEFYKQAFGAIEHERHLMPGTTKVMNAQLSINGGVFMLADDFLERDEHEVHDAGVAGRHIGHDCPHLPGH